MDEEMKPNSPKKVAINEKKNKELAVCSYLMTTLSIGFVFLMMIAICFFLDVISFQRIDTDFLKEVVNLIHSISSESYEGILKELFWVWELMFIFGILITSLLAMHQMVTSGRLNWKPIILNMLTQVGMYEAIVIAVSYGSQIVKYVKNNAVDYFNLYSFDQTIYINSFKDISSLYEIIFVVFFVLILIGIGFMKIYRFLILIFASMFFPFLVILDLEKASLLWKKLLVDGIKFLLDSLIGIVLLMIIIASIINEWSFIYVLMVVLSADIIMSFVKYHTPELEITKLMRRKNERRAKNE
jgi:hypothetical protein